ncbi:MAG: GntR family transcriptional regulator, partial [Anaerolineae bacterium]
MRRLNLSDQVVQILRERIEQGVYGTDESLPAVSDLAIDLGVGRSTVREALKQLETMGLVSIRHGKGVYVLQPKIEFASRLLSFSELVRERGMEPGARVLHSQVKQADATLAAKLALKVGDAVNHIVRLRLADGAPMAIENSYYPYDLFPGLIDQPGLDESLYTVLSKVYDRQITYAVRTIEAVLSRPEENKLLELRGRQPALLIETLAMDREQRPMEYGKSLYRADRFK